VLGNARQCEAGHGDAMRGKAMHGKAWRLGGQPPLKIKRKGERMKSGTELNITIDEVKNANRIKREGDALREENQRLAKENESLRAQLEAAQKEGALHIDREALGSPAYLAEIMTGRAIAAEEAEAKLKRDLKLAQDMLGLQDAHTTRLLHLIKEWADADNTYDGVRKDAAKDALKAAIAKWEAP
jgi:hypothetical protein